MNTTIVLSKEDKEYIKELEKFDRRKKSNLIVTACRHYGKSIGFEEGDNNVGQRSDC